jgi:soluble lytic murein transglycosylase-like protein
MLTSETLKAIDKWSKYYKIPEALVFSIITVESNSYSMSLRLEKHLKGVGWYEKALQGLKLKSKFHYCSFGLMQIMYGNARHLGFIGSPFDLFNPEHGVHYGCKFLSKLLKRYKSTYDAVSAYNQGNNRFYDINKNGIKDKNEKYRNQQYVDKVMRLEWR